MNKHFKEMRQQIIFDILDRFPDAPTLSLAKKLYKENNESFSNLDSARSIIRYYRGTHGNLNRKRLTIKKYVKSLQTA